MTPAAAIGAPGTAAAIAAGRGVAWTTGGGDPGLAADEEKAEERSMKVRDMLRKATGVPQLQKAIKSAAKAGLHNEVRIAEKKLQQLLEGGGPLNGAYVDEDPPARRGKEKQKEASIGPEDAASPQRQGRRPKPGPLEDDPEEEAQSPPRSTKREAVAAAPEFCSAVEAWVPLALGECDENW